MPFNNDYHLKWDLIEDPFPPERDNVSAGQPLDLEQTRNYLETRLTQAGGDGQAVFTEMDVERIYLASKGIPGSINQLARQTLCDPADVFAFRDPAKLRLGLWFAGAGVAVVILLLLSLVVLPDQSQQSAAVKRVAIDLPAEPPSTTTVSADNRSESTQLNSTPVANTEVLVAEKPKPVEETPPAPVVVAKKETVTVKPEFKKPDTDEALILGVKTQAWVDSQDGRQYVLQLVGAEGLETIRRYIERTGLKKAELALVKTRRNGRDWYVLLYGLYPDKARARQAIQQLPDYAKGLGPWPRQLDDLAQE